MAEQHRGGFYESSSPRVVARINGQVYAANDFEIDLNAHGATSSASVVLPISPNPDFSAEFDQVGDKAIIGEIFVGWPPDPVPGQKPSINGLERAYYGMVAQYDPDFTADRVTFELRSLASPLVDEKIQMIAVGATTVQFIQSVCDKFGLNLVTQLGNAPLTVQQVLGAMYVGGFNFAQTIHGMRIWDLILQCAQFDNVDVWEDQGTVYYVAPSLISRQTIDLEYDRDVSLAGGLRGSHALMFSKNVQVEVRTAQPRVSQSSAVRIVTNDDGSIDVTKTSKTTTGSPVWGTPDVTTTTIYPDGSQVTKQASGSGGRFGGTTGVGSESTKERYIYFLKNADPASANAFAISRWRQISQHEYTIQIELPLTQQRGLIPMTALFNLDNAPYLKFNSTYYPRKLLFSGGADKAFAYSIDAVNHPPPQGAV